jgi:hypothetical protein
MDAEPIESTTAAQDDAPSTLATTASAAEPVAVWGDASYGTANVVERLESAHDHVADQDRVSTRRP